MTGVWALAGLGVALAGVLVATRRPPAAALPELDGYLDGWSAVHGGVDARSSVWLRGWLALTFAVGRPLARWGAHPDVLTLLGLWLAGWVWALAGWEAAGCSPPARFAS